MENKEHKDFVIKKHKELIKILDKFDSTKNEITEYVQTKMILSEVNEVMFSDEVLKEMEEFVERLEKFKADNVG